MLTEEVTGSSGSFDVDTAELEPGGYDAVLTAGDGAELASVGFWIRDPNAQIEVSTDRATYGVGEPIVVSWTDGRMMSLSSSRVTVTSRGPDGSGTFNRTSGSVDSSSLARITARRRS